MPESADQQDPWKVLSVRTPWSYLICHGIKDVENRSYPTDFRGRLYIHSSGEVLTASEAKDWFDVELLRQVPTARSWLQEGLDRGANEPWLKNKSILGHVDVVDCVQNSSSPWAEEDQYHWLLANAVLFDEPWEGIPGQLKLWTFDPVKHHQFALKSQEILSDEPVALPEPRVFVDRPFTTTDQHATFWAWDLSRRSNEDSYAKIAGSMMGAQVDLNPHQVDAALFALKSPLSKGVLLADEVGLGKTIEAGIVLAQKWAERKRKILLILPATLRKQWSVELAEKFFLPSVIVENKSFKEAEAKGVLNPFDQDDAIVLTSYQFAAKKAGYIQRIGWNLVVIDEAHRVRNSYQKSNQMGRAIKDATAHAKKILLTATPLQNSLMELFGLLSFIDPHAFGSKESFQNQYAHLAEEGRFAELRQRIAPFFHRTLRRQVLEYIQYTKRIAMTETFTPSDEEQSFYDDFTAWLQTPKLYSIPQGQRPLMTLVLHKLIASSTFAVENALKRMLDRTQDILEDLDGVDSEAEDWEDEDETPVILVDPVELEKEIALLGQFQKRAQAISQNAKGNKLLTALEVGFQKMASLGAADKAIIFTESRRTQKYLLEILTTSPYAGSIVLFNGDNSDPESKAIYREWLAKNKGSDRITGSPTSDMRAALVERFKTTGRIMIATEAAAEGVNLQFCSLLINYDLPWNPQRIEQRIGRCHRYGQKFDVVVINFLNTKNRADERVYELLNLKLKLFEGVFGASDDVLGALGSGVDFEKRILGIYQTCRSRDEIDRAFGQLQLELEESINTRMTKTNQKVIENLDEEVHRRLKMRETEALSIRSSQERALYYLTKHTLAGSNSPTEWDDARFHFRHEGQQYQFNPGPMENVHSYRLQHPLAEKLIESERGRAHSENRITFHYTGRPVLGALEQYIGTSGWMQVEVLTRESTHETEESLIIAAMTDGGDVVHPEVAQKLFQLGGEASPLPQPVPEALGSVMTLQRKTAREISEQRNQEFFSAEIDKLELWAEDLKNGLELRIKELEVLIRENKKASTLAAALDEKLAYQKTVRELETERTAKRRRLFDAQDEIDAKRDAIIREIEGQLQVKETSRSLFTIQWMLE